VRIANIEGTSREEEIPTVGRNQRHGDMVGEG